MTILNLLPHIQYEFKFLKKYEKFEPTCSGLVIHLALKLPKKISKYENLYFVGGSVNPGGGMPMVTLSGINAAKEIIKRKTLN